MKRIRKELSSKGQIFNTRSTKTRAVRSARSLCQILIYFPEKGFAPQKRNRADRRPKPQSSQAAGSRSPRSRKEKPAL